MIPAEIIRNKREGLELSEAEIKFMVDGASKGSIPDYQLSAWLMSIYFKSMTDKETLCFTDAMKNSGISYDWKNLNPELKNFPLVDKHSTGGVGDKVSLILVPLAVNLGLRVPMMSGRGLGHTGGTVDKLLSIPGFKMEFSIPEAAKLMSNVGAVMLSQSSEICPADKKLYHLRDVTATVESLPLITGSIVSKKWAEGCESIIFDVKFGEGAFMDTAEKAEELGRWLLRVSKLAGLKAEALLSRMEEPLGSCIGNALEVKESIWILKNEYPSPHHKEIAKNLKKLCCQTAARMAILGGTRKDYDSCVEECEKFLDSGKAFQKFNELVLAQGGVSKWEEKLPTYATYTIPSPQDGTVSDIKARDLGILGVDVGIGRKRMEDSVDAAAGFELLVTVGTSIKKGEPLAYVHLKETPTDNFKKKFLDCFLIENQNQTKTPTKELLWKILHQV